MTQTDRTVSDAGNQAVSHAVTPTSKIWRPQDAVISRTKWRAVENLFGQRFGNFEQWPTATTSSILLCGRQPAALAPRASLIALHQQNGSDVISGREGGPRLLLPVEFTYLKGLSVSLTQDMGL